MTSAAQSLLALQVEMISVGADRDQSLPAAARMRAWLLVRAFTFRHAIF